MPKLKQSRSTDAKLSPYWTTNDGQLVKLYHGDVLQVLRQLPSQSVHCVVTSPPYWGLRDYGVDHQLGSEKSPDCLGWARGVNCAEDDWENGCHVCRMVLVFREVRRVLRDDGTFWLNYGDTYNAPGLQGNLVGVPWRVALALQADGWVLRQDVIWHKPSPMPESAKNRCTKAHEYVFLLAKRSGYFYDAEAVREAGEGFGRSTGKHGFRAERYTDSNSNHALTETSTRRHSYEGGRNKRSVWTIASEAYSGAHFATFPRKLIEPCIKAGTSEKGCCAKCGAPWKRIVEERKLKRDRPNDYVKRKGEEGTGNSCANSVAGVETKTLGWEPSYGCDDAGVVPCVVLDPFVGSGTSCAVSLGLGRRSVGIELNEKYLQENAIPRVEGAVLEIPTMCHLVGSAPKKAKFGEPL